jgi:lichenan operon transcriptional antiterminator
MLDRKLQELIRIMPRSSFVTAKKLASIFDVSDRTIRNRIIELNQFLKKHSAEIVGRQNNGYQLSIGDKDKFDAFMKAIDSDTHDNIPQTFEERIRYTLENLLYSDAYIKLDELSSRIFISKNTLSNDLKKIKKYLAQYGLSIIRTPHYGMKIRGSEFNRRLFIAYYLTNDMRGRRNDVSGEDIKQMQAVADSILSVLNTYKMGSSELPLDDIFSYVFTSIKRMRRGFCIETDGHGSPLKNCESEFNAAEAMARKLESVFEIQFTTIEIQYIATYLAGMGIFNKDYDAQEPPEHIQNMAKMILQVIFELFKIDFREGGDIRGALCQHLIPLEIRLKYNIRFKNPLLEDVKRKYVFAYALASQAVIPIRQNWGGCVTPDEIGYLAVIFALEWERLKDKRKFSRKKILLICESGMSSSQLLAYRLKKAFPQHIEEISICGRHYIDEIALGDIDFALSTIPLDRVLPIPVFEVQLFLDDSDLKEIRQILVSNDEDFLTYYFSKDLFFTDVPGTTKEEVIGWLCEQIGNVEALPGNFCDSVLARESLAETDYGNLVAFPHPSDTITPLSFVCVGILKKAIRWVQNDVQLVLLVSLAPNEDFHLQDFYQVTTDFIMSKEKVCELIDKKNFQALLNLLGKPNS